MYEDLRQIAEMRFMRDSRSLSEETKAKIQEMRAKYAAMLSASHILGSGPHLAAIGRAEIEGSVKIVHRLSEIWIDLITRRNQRLSRSDVPFICGELNNYCLTQRGSLIKSFQEQKMGAVVNLLSQEAGRELNKAVTVIRRDLEISVREVEAFPADPDTLKERAMSQVIKRRFSSGRRVLVGHRGRTAVVIAVEENPSEMGEFRHIVRFDREGTEQSVLGCDLQPFPELDEDLRRATPAAVNLHIENSTLGNLNLGSQIGTINIALETVSDQGPAFRGFAEALREFTEATLSQHLLTDSEKSEIVQALSTVAEQATKKPDERSYGTLKAVLLWLPSAISAATDLVTLWDKCGPAIKVFFRI